MNKNCHKIDREAIDQENLAIKNRNMKDTIKDTIKWLQEKNYI